VEAFRPIDGNHWVGFATRTLPLHRLRAGGFWCAVFSCLPLIVGGFPLLDSKRDPDYDMAVIIALIGAVMLVGGLLMVYVDGVHQKREINRGRILATGVFWNPSTTERRERESYNDFAR